MSKLLILLRIPELFNTSAISMASRLICLCPCSKYASETDKDLFRAFFICEENQFSIPTVKNIAPNIATTMAGAAANKLNITTTLL